VTRTALITGMSGVGKSTLLRELARRGLETVDADDDTWCIWVDGDDPGYLWREDKIAELLPGADRCLSSSPAPSATKAPSTSM